VKGELVVVVVMLALFLAGGAIERVVGWLGERRPELAVNNLRLWLLVAYLWRWRR
jgi:hypothetical protein